MRRGDRIGYICHLFGDRLDFLSLLLDDMRLNLTDVGMHLPQDVVLDLGQLLQLFQQGVLP